MKLTFIDAADALGEDCILVPWRTGDTIVSVATRVREALAMGGPTRPIYVQVAADAADVRLAWQLLEAVPSANVKLDWPADAAERPAVVVPTLNLRIGRLRITRLDDKAKNFVKRLAGVGSSAFVVIDPPAGENRLAEAQAIATALHEVVAPPKPKPKVTPKPVPKK